MYMEIWTRLIDVAERSAAFAREHGLLERDVSKLYIELTFTMILAFLTALACVRVVPYMMSAFTFFCKFCLCTLILSLTMQFLRQSELFQALSTLLF